MMPDVLWCGQQNEKLYIQSGQVTSTVSDSLSVSGIGTDPNGVCWDETDYGWCRIDNYYRWQSGFTSTVKLSVSLTPSLGPQSISWDGADTMLITYGTDKMYRYSAKTATIRDSQATSAATATGIAWDGTNTPWTHYDVDKLKLQSGNFTSTLKSSIAVGSLDNQPHDNGHTPGGDTVYLGNQTDKIYILSGQFTTTVHDSEDVTSTDNTAVGVEPTDQPKTEGAPPPVAGYKAWMIF
jgi:hypothetical protein